MSEKVWIALIVAIAALLVVFLLRRQLKSLVLKGPGLRAEVKTHGADGGNPRRGKRASVNISDFKQTGYGNELDISRGDTNVERAKQIGKDQKIKVTADKPDQD